MFLSGIISGIYLEISLEIFHEILPKFPLVFFSEIRSGILPKISKDLSRPFFRNSSEIFPLMEFRHLLTILAKPTQEYIA